MKLILSNRNLVILLLVVLTLSILSDIIHSSNLKFSYEVTSFNRRLGGEEKRALDLLNDIKTRYQTIGTGTMSDLFTDKDGKEISFAIYRNSRLEAWSDNSYELPVDYDSTLFSNPFIFLYNRWFVVNRIGEGENEFISLISIRSDYPIQNEYIVSGYDKFLSLPKGTGFSLIENIGYPVYNTKGEYLFSLTFDKDQCFITLFVVVPLLLWILFLSILLALQTRIAVWLTRKDRKLLSFLVQLLGVIIVYIIFLVTGKPEFTNHIDIFGSDRFSLGPLVPSPGHLLLLSILFLYISVGFYRNFPLPERTGRKFAGDLICLSCYLVPAVLLFTLFDWLLEKYVILSNINFDIYRILDLDHFTLVAITSLFLIPVGAGIYILRILSACRKISDRVLVFATIIVSLIPLAILLPGGRNPAIEIAAFILMVVVARISRTEKSTLLNTALLFALVVAGYSAYRLPAEARQRETRNLKVLAVNYSTDNDYYAESLLIGEWETLCNDTLLASMMKVDRFTNDDAVAIYDYLDSRYFNGYWENYEKIYTICNDDSQLMLEDGGTNTNCFDFFAEKRDSLGLPMIDSSLVFMDSRSGRAYYMGCIYFDNIQGGSNGLFIELVNQLKFIQSGYPELLLNERFLTQPMLKKYSVAKYYNDTLAIQTGVEPFDPILAYRNDRSKEYNEYRQNGTDYLIYNHSPSISVVITRNALRFTDHIVTFTYFFVLLFILLVGVLVIVRPPAGWSISGFDFRQKLQFAFVTILLGSIIAIGSVVIVLSIAQYRNKHLDSIKEKLSSVYIELEHKLAGESKLDESWSAEDYESLDALLVKFSNVFYTDINLYRTDGTLLATSRRDLFDKKLSGDRMDFTAFTMLNGRGLSEFVHEETLGRLKYLSAYNLFLNNRNEVLAYLNLPYFNVQSRLSEEISNLVVAITNFSLILIVIAMSIAVFISGRITNPLRMLQEGLASFRLGEESSPLVYRGKDEIGKLVEQYNVMLRELHDSALKLARSEREYAWREMAKQIAHEIKNPLTPMKLSVQQLYKSWSDGAGDFDERIRKFSESQIEHISSLSAIATEFSNFARMPRANPVRTDLIEQINHVSGIFSNISNIQLTTNFNNLGKVMVMADREQLNSLLTNLIRNAVQSIPSNRKGVIEVRVEEREKKVRIYVQDNGAGIPEDLRDRLFIPNFTTKSSGMGLGLAIAKRIVETAGGEIWFRSEVYQGTTFIVELPVVD